MRTLRLHVERWLPLVLLATLSVSTVAADYNCILVPPGCHPAVNKAARMIAQELGLPESAIATNTSNELLKSGQLLLSTGETSPPGRLRLILHGPPTTNTLDGYTVIPENGGTVIQGARPRSLLFAAGEVKKWREWKTFPFFRHSLFTTRAAYYHYDRPVAEYVAEMGVNLLTIRMDNLSTLKDSLPEVFDRLSPQQQASLLNANRYASSRARQLARECRDADVEFYPFLYGNDFARWSGALYDAVIAAYPTAKGVPPPSSWERATLCPSDPATWKVMEAFVREFADRSGGDGLYATFWDNYGLDCQCERCVRSGMNQFSNQLHACVTHYRNALAPLKRKLVVRTWSSGVPHWFNEQWVHAPGNNGFSGTATALWSRVIAEVPADVILQTKVYDADCQPDPPFSSLLGHAKPHAEIAEYQITGQTTGRFYFPAATVEHTAWTMNKSFMLIGMENGVHVEKNGVYVDASGAKQPDFNLLDDIANSINAYAWRELSWNHGRDVNAIWMEWAVPIYGEQAAPHIVKALKLSENTVNRLFSTLGLGNDTNSGFPTSIKRRETLLKYTNRYFDPEYARFLEPTQENIQRVIDEKLACLKLIDEMFRELELARPYLRKEQADELATRFDWLREFAIVTRHLDESLWRYRYLRHQAAMLTTDPEQMKFLAESYDAVKEHQPKLFQFDPRQKFSCYSVPLGSLSSKPSLGDPMPLMRELYDASRKLVEESVGPDRLPPEWRR
jgi:hypothetical protein